MDPSFYTYTYTSPKARSGSEEEYKPLSHASISSVDKKKTMPMLANKNHADGVDVDVEMVFSFSGTSNADADGIHAELIGHHNSHSSSNSKRVDWQLIGGIFSFLISIVLIFLFATSSSASDTFQLDQLNINANAGHQNQNLIEIPEDFSHSPPLVILSYGCSGSSVAFRTTKAMLEAHGIPIYETWDSELYNLRKNPFSKQAEDLLIQEQRGVSDPTDDEIILKAMELLHQEAQNENKVLLMKAPPNLQTSPVTNWLMKNANARFTHTFRANILDLTVCSVRDCFGGDYMKQIGHPVFSNGTESNLCFARRSYHNISTMAYLNPETIIDALKVQQKNLDDIQFALGTVQSHSSVKHTANSTTTTSLSYEALFAHVYTPDESIFQVTVQAWMDFLDPFFMHPISLSPPNRVIIEQVLRKSQDSLVLMPHAHVIYNHEDVKAAIDNYDQMEQKSSFASFWRS
jgi:hypothetical protein